LRAAGASGGIAQPLRHRPFQVRPFQGVVERSVPRAPQPVREELVHPPRASNGTGALP